MSNDIVMDISYFFDQVLDEFGVSNVWLGEKSGVSPVVISRFRNGKQIQTGTLAKLIPALPAEPREKFLGRLNGGAPVLAYHPSLLEMIKKLDLAQAEDRQTYAAAFKALSDRFSEFEKVAQARESSLSKGREPSNFSENTDEMVSASK